MDPFIGGSLIAGGLDFLGSLLGGSAAAQAQSQANSANLGIATQNLQFQERMSNTAYERATADMKRAGINPLMAAMKGGASTPPGAQATMQPAINDGLARGLKGISGSAMNAMTLKADIDQKGAQASLARAAALTEAEKAKATSFSAQESKLRSEVIAAEMPATKAKAVYNKRQAEWDTEAQSYDNITKRLKQAVDVGSSALDMIPGVGSIFKGGNKPQGGAKELMDALNKAYRRSNRQP